MQKKLNCVLLIDDDEPTNFLNRMLIDEAHCTDHIQVAQTGQAALNYLTNSENFACENKNFPCPQLIFLDINMPAMNGWEFLEKYNKLGKEHKSEIIIVMLTTSLNPDDEIKAKNIAGVIDFRHKPLTKKILNEVLHNYFAGHFTNQQA